MADDSVVVVDDDNESKIVTKFLLNTCRLLQPSIGRVKAAASVSIIARKAMVARYSPGDEVHRIPMITGSSAEFYIQPMLSCVGDVDIMVHDSDQLAIPDGYPPPTELPAEFHSRVSICEIIDSEYPGYVYLMLSYLLTEDSDTGKYNAITYDKSQYVVTDLRHQPDTEYHRPAMTVASTKTAESYDRVYCVRCLSWPPQAADWPTRHRNYDWPDSATVDQVVNNGCDVVHVAHPQCTQDEWMSKAQWRLSFSRAEVVLLSSWMPIQQIVYHMLRFFVKTERLTDTTDSSERKIFSNYHIKTLTLWACEVQPQRWWTDDMDVVRMSTKLLHIFADWLKNKLCPHYFVNNCNLINSTVFSDIIASQLMSITESSLSTWFVNSYLRKCAQLCFDRVSRLFDDVSTSMKLQNAVSAVVDWRLNSALSDLSSMYFAAEHYVSMLISSFSLTVWSYNYWINELVKIDSCLLDYSAAVSFLRVANRIAKHSLSDELLDVLTTVIGQFVCKRRHCHQLSSELSLNQAVVLMKVAANNTRRTVQQIEFELSKGYLYRALRRKDFDSIYCLANAYLAVLYYTSGQYQTAIDHCTLVTRSQDHSQCSSRIVQGDLLPNVDDNIDSLLGLAVFYQYVRMAALNQQQTQYVVAFTTELFAHYLYIRCLLVMECRHFTKMLSTDEFQRHTKYILDSDHLFIADVLILKSIKMSELKCHYKPQSEQRQYSTINASELDTSELVELLQQSAVERLTAIRQFEAQQLGSLVKFVTSDFEALYAYKHGDYQRCLQLSTQNVHTLLFAYQMPLVWLYPEFLQLIDDDIVSLTAMTLIVNPECRAHYSNVGVSQLTLSLYLLTQCQLNLHHSVTSLAQTLDYIEVAQRRCPADSTLDNLTLTLTERKAMIYLSQSMQR